MIEVERLLSDADDALPVVVGAYSKGKPNFIIISEGREDKNNKGWKEFFIDSWIFTVLLKCKGYEFIKNVVIKDSVTKKLYKFPVSGIMDAAEEATGAEPGKDWRITVKDIEDEPKEEKEEKAGRKNGTFSFLD